MFHDALKKLRSILMIMPLFIVMFVTLPDSSLAGTLPQTLSDQGHVANQADDLIVGYWDLRNRESFFQLTNVSGGLITVHIQIWNASDPNISNVCTEFDFTDIYTGFDTHIYDLRNLSRNNGVPLAPPILDGGHGYIIASTTDPMNITGCTNQQALIGNFKIKDIPGKYEYRGTALGSNNNSANKEVFSYNFNDISSTGLSDIVIFHIERKSSLGGLCSGVPDDLLVSRVFIDLSENIISCPTSNMLCKSVVDNSIVQFGVNFGINQNIQNSRGAVSLCAGTDANGWMIIADGGADCEETDGFCGGWVGINNGNGTGSMDAFIGLPGRTEDYF